jgi:hypothetical protein
MVDESGSTEDGPFFFLRGRINIGGHSVAQVNKSSEENSGLFFCFFIALEIGAKRDRKGLCQARFNEQPSELNFGPGIGFSLKIGG